MLRILSRCIVLRKNCATIFLQPNLFTKRNNLLKYDQMLTGSFALAEKQIFRCFATFEELSDSDNENVEESYDNELLDSDGKQILMSLKDVLYTNTKDPILLKLKQSSSIDETFTILKQVDKDIKVQHLIQSVLGFWEYQRKITGSKNKFDLLDNEYFIEQNPVVEATKLIDREDFQLFLQKIKNFIKEMSPDEVSCALLYLHKCGLKISNDIFQEMLDHCLNLLDNKSIDFPLTALSRFSVTINSTRDFGIFTMHKHIIPKVLEKLDNCKESEDLRLLTICMSNTYALITENTIKLYKNKILELYENGVLNKTTVKCILKVVNFLNFAHWSQGNNKIIRKLVLLLKDNISNLQAKELIALCKVFQSQLEPAILIEKITVQSQKLIEKTPSAELLACSVLYALPENRNKISQLVSDIIKSNNISLGSTLPALFKVLRLLKISNLQLCNSYWSKVLQEIRTNPNELENYRLARHCHRYMHFNNNLGGTYRHYEFEKATIQLIMHELKFGITGIIPTKYSRLASFVIAYGHTPKSNYMLPEFVVEKIEAMAEQFSTNDCLHLSRGIQVALELRFRHHIPTELAPQLVRIESVLNNCAERQIENKNLQLSEINSIIRAYNNRKSSRKTNLFQKIIDKYKTVETELNSRLIRDITFNLNASGYRIPSICKKLFNYIDKNEEFILGDTVEKILYCCYNLGYLPENDNVLQKSAAVLHRDFNYMNGLSIIQACLALSFYKALPIDLVNRVFCIDFIRRLEDEIKLCYSKATYPERVLNQVMQLNRAVCLDFPEASVPWFQQNYMEAQMSKFPVVQSNFHTDIRHILTSFTSDPNNVKINHITPYGYRVDFVLHFDKSHKIIPPPKEDKNIENISKVGILLLQLDSFCENDTSYLRGQAHLRQRHLEILGYKVIHINQSEWNSMYMNIPGAKISYLKQLLQLS